MKIAVIGIGSFGKNHVRVIKELGYEVTTIDTNLRAIADWGDYSVLRPKGQYSGTPGICVDAAVVATPASTHYEICKYLLENKIPALVEKPMTMDYNQALELVAIAEDNNVVFAVGHIFRFHPLTSAIIGHIVGMIELDNGKILVIKSVRSGLHQPSFDCGVLWDFAVHDVDLIEYLLSKIRIYKGEIKNVHAVRGHPLGNKYEDIASLVYQRDGIYISVDVDWVSPVKERTLKIITTAGTIEADYVKEELKIHMSGHIPPERDHGEAKFNIRMGNIIIPQITHEEALKEELKEFIEAVNGNILPINDAVSCLPTIKLLSMVAT